MGRPYAVNIRRIVPQTRSIRCAPVHYYSKATRFALQLECMPVVLGLSITVEPEFKPSVNAATRGHTARITIREAGMQASRMTPLKLLHSDQLNSMTRGGTPTDSAMRIAR